MRRSPPILLGLSLLSLAALAWSCDGPPPRAPTAAPIEAAAAADELPASSASYGTEPTPGATLGGAASTKAEGLLLGALRGGAFKGRALKGPGAEPLGDGRLGLVASWAVHRAARGVPTDSAMIDAVSRRVGFVGPTPWILYFRVSGDLDGSKLGVELAEQVAPFPQNIAVTRYGIATIGRAHGELIAVAIGSVELTLAAVPKRVAVNEALRLSGSIGDRFTHAHLAITFPHGSVKTWDSASRDVSTPIQFPDPGVHRVELFGDGETGPVVVANFPIYVATEEPSPDPPDGAGGRPSLAAAPTPANVEARMLELLNAARAEAKVKPLERDDALAAVALAHSQDMLAHEFVGHVSPTTGTPEDRLRRAHELLPMFGENVSAAATADDAHRGLMDSPGHRANMLQAEFTHVGIGAVVRDEKGSNPGVIATLVFGRRHPIAAAAVPARVAEQLTIARLGQGLAALKLDDGLTRAAQEATAVLASSPGATDQALGATTAALKRQNRRAAACAVIVDTPDVWDLPPPAVAYMPRVERVGIAALPGAEGPEAFRVVIVLESARGWSMPCE